MHPTEDPLRIGGRYGQPRGDPGSFGIGGQDLFPPSPFLPGFQGGNPSGWSPSGNYIGPNHPGFGPVNDPFRNQGPMPGRGNPRGRFDPFGPPGTNFPFGPDRDDFQPPGSNFGGGFM